MGSRPAPPASAPGGSTWAGGTGAEAPLLENSSTPSRADRWARFPRHLAFSTWDLKLQESLLVCVHLVQGHTKTRMRRSAL